MMLYIFTAMGEMAGLAIALARRRYPVRLAIVDDLETLSAEGLRPFDKVESQRTRQKRLALADGLVEKIEAKDAVRSILRSRNKSKIGVLFDMNYLFRYASVLADTGVRGHFPTAWDARMELDRAAAKSFVSEFYDGIQETPRREFKSVAEAADFIRESDRIWVIKPNSADATTYVPRSNDISVAQEEVLGALERNKKDYESEGFVLEEKLIDMVEITPERLYVDGQVVWEVIDIETKELGSGGIGPTVGCAQDLVFRLDKLGRKLGRQIQEIAFPPVVDEMARRRGGIFLWDASLYLTPEGVYFGEFCPNRFGYNSLYTEIELSGLDVDDFVEGLFSGRVEMMDGYGASVRLFGLAREEDGSFSESHGVIPFEDGYWWLSVKDDGGIRLADVGDRGSVALDVGVVTGYGKSFEDAVDEVYRRVTRVSWDGIYYRPKADYLGDHFRSIKTRFNNLQVVK